jgi:hypothetical protein
MRLSRKASLCLLSNSDCTHFQATGVRSCLHRSGESSPALATQLRILGIMFCERLRVRTRAARIGATNNAKREPNRRKHLLVGSFHQPRSFRRLTGEGRSEAAVGDHRVITLAQRTAEKEIPVAREKIHRHEGNVDDSPRTGLLEPVVQSAQER